MVRSVIRVARGTRRGRLVHKKSRRVRTYDMSPKRTAHTFKTKNGQWRAAPRRRWARTKGRKLTVIERVFQWIRVPTTRVRRSR